MSKKSIICEQQVAIESLEADYAKVVRQRDMALRAKNAYEVRGNIRDAAKREAAIQEKVDGIKAGLIPVEELRRAFDTLEVDADGTAFVTYRFDKNVDRLQKALSDVLTAKPKENHAVAGVVNGRIFDSFFPWSHADTFNVVAS